MAKPTDLPRWAEEVDGTPATNIVEPNAGKKDLGWTTGGDVPTSDGLNWYMRLVYKWAQWLDAFAAADGTIDWSQLGAVGAILKSAVADGSSAVGHISDTVNALANASSKLWSWKNHGVEKAYIDKDGRIVPAGIDLLASALQTILKGGTGGLDIGTSIAADLRILLNSVAEWTFRASDGALVSNGKPITGLPAANGSTEPIRKAEYDKATPVLSATSAYFTTTSNTYVDVLEVTIVSTGKPIVVALVPDGSGCTTVGPLGNATSNPVWCAFAILMDSVKISESRIEIGIEGGAALLWVPPGSIHVVATPAAGSHVFKLQAIAGTGDTIHVYNCKLLAYEI